jgi:hypothetical protein
VEAAPRRFGCAFLERMGGFATRRRRYAFDARRVW